MWVDDDDDDDDVDDDDVDDDDVNDDDDVDMDDDDVDRFIHPLHIDLSTAQPPETMVQHIS